MSPITTSAIVVGLNSELVSLRSDVAGVGDVDVLQWHDDNRKKRPTFWLAASLCVQVQPSSGAAERVFSQLKALWGDRQRGVLGDAIKISLMGSFNKRPV